MTGLKVLHLVHNYPPEFRGGVEHTLIQTAKSQRLLGASVVIGAGSERVGSQPEIRDEEFEGVPVRRLIRGPGFRTPADPFEPTLVHLLEQLLDSEDPDLVHVHHWWNLGSDIVRRAARNAPVVVTLHDFYANCSRFFRMLPDGAPCEVHEAVEACTQCLGDSMGGDSTESRFRIGLRMREFRAELMAASRILAPSSSHASRLKRFLGSEFRIDPLWLGTPEPATSGRTRTTRSDGPLRVLHFGNLSRLKGVHVLCEAVAIAKAAGASIDLILAGRVVEGGLKTGDARLVGAYDANDLADLADAADLAVFPSLAHETYGLVVDEALRLSLPVIVSDRGAPSERIGDRGVVVPADNPQALADVLIQLAKDRSKVDRLASGRPRDLLSGEEHARRLLEIYDEVLANRSPEAPTFDLESAILERAAHLSSRAHEAFAVLAQHLGGEKRGESEVAKPVEALTDATTAPVSRPSARPPDPSGRMVSVITRTRNRPELLKEAVASVAAQTHPEREMLIINDGGCDVSSSLDPFRDRLKLRLLEPGRIGRCRAGNLGLQEAHGTWIAWLDDDDLYDPAHLEVLLNSTVANGFKVGYSDAYRIDQVKDEGTGEWREASRSVPYSLDFSKVALFRNAYIHLVTLLHHRECVERLGGFDEKLEVLEDHDMLLRFAQDYDFHHLKMVTAAFRIRNDQSNAVTALRSEFVQTRTLLFQRYAHLCLPELVTMLEQGQSMLADLDRRVRDLERSPDRSLS